MKISIQNHLGYDNGEHWLLVNSPIFKRRYTIDCDIVMGCMIGCKFCYYRWVGGTDDLIGTGRTKALCLPNGLAEILEASKLVRKDKDGIMLCARSDGSVQVRKIEAFLKAYRYKNPIFILHRGYFGPRQLDAFSWDERVVFSTTLTPRGRELDWTPIDERKQLKGIEYLLKKGILPRRISVEVGPINEHNVDRAVDILKELEKLGLEFATYRGVSVGTFGLPSPEDGLKGIGFLTTQKRKAPGGHAYYKIKNVLAERLEEKIRTSVQRLRLHRFTGTLYRDEFGMDVAYNRNNRWRKELGMFKKADVDALAGYIESLGLPVKGIDETPEGYFVRLKDEYCATEDIAMTVGAEFNTCVLFDGYRPAPTMEDLKLYFERGLITFSKL
ncbi:hypothetical protein AN618_21500 [Fervidicola ferrireducens]|uniref:Radical SAM core domain-containing protein n=1 Tax=Fervidicola ferrireducens TaxID=520764 RepID=A0A140L2T3_9FIRM|nr:hypothetical protein [Fervidicola ferrireducens]KXG74858.1 hypothetical protein AN618_21500 [Fervidicola ferrireducens]